MESAAVAAVQGRTASDILGGIDAKKLRSSMTLFRRADPHQPLPQGVVDQYFDGLPDPATEQLLRPGP